MTHLHNHVEICEKENFETPVEHFQADKSLSIAYRETTTWLFAYLAVGVNH